MSPEQARDEPLDFRTDLFSLGAVLFEASTGRAPFQAATSYGTLWKIVDHRPTPLRQLNPDLPEWFERLVSQLMAKDPRQRFQTSAEVATLLKQCLAHVEQPYLVRLPAPLDENRGRGAVLFWRIAMSVTLIVTLLSGGWWLMTQVGDADAPVVQERSAAVQNAPAAAGRKEEEPTLPSVTLDKHTVSVRKVADVSGMKMDMDFDVGKLGLQQQGQAFGNPGGEGFAGGAGGGGSFKKPSLGIALIVESSSANDRTIVEISAQATAIDD